jgi:DNA-binding NarL/FixJ family response regulator
MRSTLSSITVDVVHEFAIVRNGLVAMLERLHGVTVYNQFATADEYVTRDCKGDVAFVSTRVPRELDRAGGATGSIGHADAPALVVVAAAFGDLDAREALERGIKGLLLLSADPAELLAAARRVFLGNRYVMPEIAARVAEHVCSESLTVREHQILEFLSDGRCNKTIANELGIAVGTVKTHVKAILSKLNVSSRTQAVVVASRRGLVRSENPTLETVILAPSVPERSEEADSSEASVWRRTRPVLTMPSH